MLVSISSFVPLHFKKTGFKKSFVSPASIKETVNGHVARHPLSPGKVAEFPPEALRSWELPPQIEEARGLTLLWSGKVMHAEESLLGVTDGFFFESWTTSTATKRLHRPKVDPLQYIEVFNGSLACTTKHGTVRLQVGDHVYVRKGTGIRFEPESPDTYVQFFTTKPPKPRAKAAFVLIKTIIFSFREKNHRIFEPRLRG